MVMQLVERSRGVNAGRSLTARQPLVRHQTAEAQVEGSGTLDVTYIVSRFLGLEPSYSLDVCFLENAFPQATTSSSCSRLTAQPVRRGLCLAGAKDPSNFSYTIAAARRSEQRKLLCFVKLADFVICDTLHNLLLDSERDLLAFAAPAPPPPLDKLDQQLALAQLTPADRKAAEEAAEAALPVPLCEVQVRADCVCAHSHDSRTRGSIHSRTGGSILCRCCWTETACSLRRRRRSTRPRWTSWCAGSWRRCAR